MLTTYVPPTKWYRREVALHFKLVLWPDWLARRLCKHRAALEFFEMDARRIKLDIHLCCPDCYKLIGYKLIDQRK